jgi:hypothetical protein
LRTRKREMRGNGENHHEKLGLQRISCVSLCTIPDMAGISYNPACNYTDARSSPPNQASRTPDFSYPLISPTLCSLSSQSLSFLSTTLPSLQNTKLSHLSLSLHTMTMKLNRVLHTPSTSIQRVQVYAEYKHPPKIDCLPFIFMIKW